MDKGIKVEKILNHKLKAMLTSCASFVILSVAKDLCFDSKHRFFGEVRLRMTMVSGVVLFSLFVISAPAFATHGSLASNVRDGWIDSRLDALIQAGVLAKPSKSLKDLTNLEVARLTKQAAEIVVAQADVLPPPMDDVPTSLPGAPEPTAAAPSAPAAPVPPANPQPAASNSAPAQVSQSVKDLVEEFKKELSVMDVDVAKLEDRIYAQQHRAEKFAMQQDDLLKKTGTNIAGFSRGFFNVYRGFGVDNVIKPSPQYNGIMLADIRLKSVPVPFVMFDAALRMTRTMGQYYADPITPNINLRWLSLTNTNEIANLTAGDFYRSYTHLTLWNTEVPVYTLTEPSSFHRNRKDVEEMVYMDHGTDWHMRGFEASSDQSLGENQMFSSFHLQAMAGELKSASALSFGEDYAGSQAALDFFEDKLEVKGTGLLVLSDTASANVPYIPALISTYGRRYEIGSLSAKGNYAFEKEGGLALAADGEWAVSRFQDDLNNPTSLFQDWALLANGSISYDKAKATIKYLDNGAYFYSPGAQTNRYTPGTGGTNYLASNQFLDNALPGYLNSLVFQGVNRPSFVPFDRTDENALPYGDATPNRQGIVLGFEAEIGKDGWLKPQASYIVRMNEIQPNYVLTLAGNSVVPVDALVTTTAARSFTGYEGAITADLAKALEGTPSTCSFSADYKHQETNLGNGENPFVVSTMLFSADMGPFPEIPLIQGLILSAAFKQVESKGREYSLGGAASPQPLGSYASYLDTAMIGSFTHSDFNLTKTTWAFGIRLPISKAFDIHGDCFLNSYNWKDVPGYDRKEQIWRMTYDVTF